MKEIKSITRAKLAAKYLNELKNENEIFTADTFTQALKMMGCPYAVNMFLILKETGLIKKIGTTQYSFTYDEPVYFKAIQKALDKISERQGNYTKNYLAKKIEPIISEEVLVEGDLIMPCDINVAIEAAILLLKANGFKLQRPVTSFEEC